MLEPRGLKKNPYLYLHQLKVPPTNTHTHLSSYTVRPAQENETFFFFCSRGWFYIVTAGLFYLKILLTSFTWQNKKGFFLLTPLFLKKKKTSWGLKTNSIIVLYLLPTLFPLPWTLMYPCTRRRCHPDSPKTASGEKPPPISLHL